MTRSDRLFRLLQLLHDGQCHRAGDLAAALGVSQRSIYRDMETLAAAGQPVTGTRGTGYRLADHVALPPLLLSAAEVEALNLGIAIVAESADPGLSPAEAAGRTGGQPGTARSASAQAGELGAELDPDRMVRNHGRFCRTADRHDRRGGTAAGALCR